jgi:hypothetical protein
MKIATITIAALALCLLTNPNAYSETIHQSMAGTDAFAAGGGAGSAVTKGQMETKDNPQATGGKVARVVGSAGQWAYVSFWFGIPAPAGKAIVRFKVWVDGTDTSTFGVYTQLKAGQNLETKLQIPADAKKDSFVNIDVPVSVTEDWSGVTIKKFDKSDKPGPWIDSVSIVLP